MADKKKQKKSEHAAQAPAPQADHVSISLQEFHAFQAQEESLAKAIEKNVKLEMDRKLLSDIQADQLSVLSLQSLKITHLERISSLQAIFIEHLKEPTKVAELADLSEFWRQWQLQAKKLADGGAGPDAVAKFTPNLFKTWEVWIRDAGKVDREMTTSGTRAEREVKQPQTQKEMQAHTIRRLREENFNYEQRLQKLQAELEEAQAKLAAEVTPEEPKTNG